MPCHFASQATNRARLNNNNRGNRSRCQRYLQSVPDLCNFSHMWFTIGWTRWMRTCHWMRAPNGGAIEQQLNNQCPITTHLHVTASTLSLTVTRHAATNQSILFGVEWFVGEGGLHNTIRFKFMWSITIVMALMTQWGCVRVSHSYLLLLLFWGWRWDARIKKGSFRNFNWFFRAKLRISRVRINVHYKAA